MNHLQEIQPNKEENPTLYCKSLLALNINHCLFAGSYDSRLLSPQYKYIMN